MSKAPIEAAIILAGGQSLRMGFDKGELDVSGRRLIDIIHGKINRQCASVLISGRRAYDLEVSNVADSIHVPKGPAAGILTLAEHLKNDVTGFFTVPVDSPNFPEDLCARLYSRAYSTIAADENGRHPTFGWWRLSDVEKAVKQVNHHESLSLNHLSRLCGAVEVNWPGENLFFNINSANDLTHYLTHIASEITR